MTDALRKLTYDTAAAFTADLADAVTPVFDGGKSPTFDSATSMRRGDTNVISNARAAAAEFISGAINQNTAPLPESLVAVFDECGNDTARRGRLALAIMDGANLYKHEHGHNPPGNLLEAAFMRAFATTHAATAQFGLPKPAWNFDSAASTSHSENMALQSDRAVVAILYSLWDAMPAGLASTLPVDIRSNQAKFAIFRHYAKTTTGMYTAGGSLDGVNVGGLYSTSYRRHKLTAGDVSGTTHWTGKVTRVMSDKETCDQNATTGLKRGLGQIFVNGLLAGAELSSAGSGSTSAISGTYKDPGTGTEYAASGTVNPTSGAYDIVFTPALPDGSHVLAAGYLDFENNPSFIAEVGAEAVTYDMYAFPDRFFAQITPDARTQIANELGIDARSEALVGGQRQYLAQRFMQALWMLRDASVHNTDEYDFNYPLYGQQKTRAMIFQDMWSTVGRCNQRMAEITLGNSMGYWFVGANMKSNLQALPGDIFRSSGVATRPGIHRIGTLTGPGIEVYYVPSVTGRKVVNESTDGDASEILAVGRADQIARAPIVTGEAVPLTPVTLGIGTDLKEGTAFHSRGFLNPNPHMESAISAALITVTGLNP